MQLFNRGTIQFLPLWRALAFACCLLSGWVSAESSSTTLMLAAEDNWPPYSDETGHGLSYRLVQTALQSQGYQLKIAVMPYPRALQATRTGKVQGCWNVTRQRNTEQEFVLHQRPLFTASASFYYADQGLAFESLAEIPDGTALGVIRGYEYGDGFEQHKSRFQLVEVSTHPQLLQLLLEHKIKVALFFDDVILEFLQREQLDPFIKERNQRMYKASGEQLPSIIKGQQFHVSELFVAFSRQDPHSQAYANALDRGLALLQADGEYQQLVQAYRRTSSAVQAEPATSDATSKP